MLKFNINKISPREIRSLLREPNNREDGVLVGAAFAKNLIGGDYFVPLARRLRTYFGTEAGLKYTKNSLIKSTKPRRYRESFALKSILPDPVYDPMKLSTINSGTKLGQGIPISMFANAPGSKSTLNHLTQTERKEIAKHLYCQVPLIQGFRNQARFSNHSLFISDGLVKPQDTETLTSGDIRELQTKGRAVVYEVLDNKGKNDAYATFQLANYWKDNHLFQGLILHFDSMEPLGEDGSRRHDKLEFLDPEREYHAEIIVVMPNVDYYYRGNFERRLRTDINFRPFIKGGLGYFQYK